MKISNPSLYGAGATSGGLLTTVNYVENRLLGVSGELSDQIVSVSTALSGQISSVVSSFTEDISEINSGLTTLSTQLFTVTEDGSNLKLKTNIIPDIALNTVHVINAVSGESLATSVSSLNISGYPISESAYTTETAKTFIIEWLSNYAEDKDLDVGDIVIVQPDDSVSSIVFIIKDLLGSWMITESPASTISTISVEQMQGQTETTSSTTSQYDATKLYVADSTIQSVYGEFPDPDGHIPLTGLKASIETINTNITNITGDIQTLNNEVDFLSGVLSGFDNTTSGNVSAYIDEIKTTTNFLSGVLSGFDNTTSGNVSAYIDNIVDDLVDDLNENLIKSNIVQFKIDLSGNDPGIECTSGGLLVSNNLISIPSENETTGPSQSLLQKMFGLTEADTDKVYKIVIKFHGKINILKLLAQDTTATDNTYVEFYPDFQEVYKKSDGSRSHTQITVFLPAKTITGNDNLITWRVTYSRKIFSAGQCLI